MKDTKICLLMFSSFKPFRLVNSRWISTKVDSISNCRLPLYSCDKVSSATGAVEITWKDGFTAKLYEILAF